MCVQVACSPRLWDSSKSSNCNSQHSSPWEAKEGIRFHFVLFQLPTFNHSSDRVRVKVEHERSYHSHDCRVCRRLVCNRSIPVVFSFVSFWALSKSEELQFQIDHLHMSYAPLQVSRASQATCRAVRVCILTHERVVTKNG